MKKEPTYEGAKEYGTPEAVIPQEVELYLLNQNGYGYEDEDGYPVSQRDDSTLLQMGVTYSPMAIRAMTQTLVHGLFIDPELPKLTIESPQFKYNALAYAYFCGFISLEEFNGKKPIRGDYPQTWGELYWTSETRGNMAKVFGTIESALIDKERNHPNKKLLLLNGTWNGIPHPGHVFAVTDALNYIERYDNIPREEVYVLVVGDSNDSIWMQDKPAFMSSQIRLSLMSYLPFIDAVALSNFEGHEDVDQYWMSKILLAQPDYLTVEVGWDNSNGEYEMVKGQKFRQRQAIAVGAKQIPQVRSGMSLLNKSEISEGMDDWMWNNSMSSTGLRHSDIMGPDGQDFPFTNPYDRLFIKKDIYQAQGWPSNWFNISPNGLIRSSRTFVQPGNEKILKI